MINRSRAEYQETSEDFCSPICVHSNGCTDPMIPTATRPNAGGPDGIPLRHLSCRTLPRPFRYRRVGTIIGATLQVLCFICGLFPAWTTEGQAADEVERPAYQI